MTAPTITFNPKNLINCITAPCNAASISKGMEIYKFAKFEVKKVNGQLAAKCTGNNGKCEVIGYDNALEGDEVCFLADARVLKDLACTYKQDKPVTITVNKNDIMLTQGRSKHSIETKNPNDYPAYDSNITGDSTKAALSANALFFALDRVCFAADMKGARPFLATINITVSEGELTFTATDSFQVSQFRVPATINGLTGVNISIPRKVALQWLTLKGKAENLMLEFNQKTSRITIGNTMLNAQLYDGDYPIDSINKVIAIGCNNAITANTKDIKDALQRITISSGKAPDKTFLTIQSTPDGEIKLSPNKVVDSSESIDAKTPASVVRVTYVLSQFSTVLNHISSKEVTLKFDEKNTTWFEDQNHKQQPIVLMPCNH